MFTFSLLCIHNPHSVVSLIYALPISLQFTQMCARLIQLDSILIFYSFLWRSFSVWTVISPWSSQLICSRTYYVNSFRMCCYFVFFLHIFACQIVTQLNKTYFKINWYKLFDFYFVIVKVAQKMYGGSQVQWMRHTQHFNSFFS